MKTELKRLFFTAVLDFHELFREDARARGGRAPYYTITVEVGKKTGERNTENCVRVQEPTIVSDEPKKTKGKNTENGVRVCNMCTCSGNCMMVMLMFSLVMLFRLFLL
ncbi:hypothetical protein L873DRAFT_1008582 [Choiromyces venosus 120613-1]|uniref:Uncharacterized protein n=1 Tax=Choiromyces venosus 120613-1 TaxID=1336337 RepID=A0A3N4JKI9_9PEZI|nr:hypothetical protein L873DRAFT_1008582 [Choiromyces venosus 120613-1]